MIASVRWLLNMDEEKTMKAALVTACSALILISSCAKAPDQIGAADIGTNVYRGYSCKQLAQSRVKHEHDLENLSAAQKSAAEGDAWGVLILGLPVSSMSGNDKEAAISITKGHIQSIEEEQQRKGCR